MLVYILITFIITQIKSELLPVVIVHGISSDASQLVEVKQYLEKKGLYVFVPNVGNGKIDSLFKPMFNQYELLKKEIQSDKKLENGFNLIGMSQGGLLARAYVERFTGTLFKVNNLITWVSPHGGILYINQNLPNIYTSSSQSSNSFSNYWRDPRIYQTYLDDCVFLPTINNEINTNYTQLQKNNLLSLNNLVVIWSTNDDVIKPQESGKFWTFDEKLNIIPMNKTPYYDTLGLNILDNNYKLHIYQTNCSHEAHKLPECFNFLEENTLPYLFN